MICNGTANFFGNDLCRPRRHVRTDQYEFFAAPPAKVIALPHIVQYQISHTGKYHITCVVATAVVNPLEMVNIKQHTCRSVARFSVRKNLPGSLRNPRSIEQPGEGIGE